MKINFKITASIVAVIITIFTLNNASELYKCENGKQVVVKAARYEPSRAGYIDMKSFSIPAKGVLTSKFGIRKGKMHNGIDIGAPYGTAIYSASSGVVSFAGWQDGYGNVIKIDHGSNIETVYAHCSCIYVRKLQKISAGEKVGEVGSTGNSTGPHVHFEIRVNGSPKDPLIYVKQI